MPAAEDDVPKRAKRQPTGDYEVGYGRPPKHGQFPKGAPSRNPRGRPPKPKTPDTIIEAASRGLVVIKHKGKLIKVTRFEAMIRRLYADALTGCRKAQRELLRLRLEYSRSKKIDRDNDGVVQTYRLIVAGQEVSETEPTRRPRPRIRRRRTETRRETFNRVSALKVTVSDNGVARRMTSEQALWHLIMACALGGDIAATRLITRYMDAISESQRQNHQEDDDDGGPRTFTLNLGRLPGLDDDEEDWDYEPEPVA